MDSRRFQTKSVSGRISPRKLPVPVPVPEPKPEEKQDPISSDLEKELTCSICTSILHHPVTLLDCLHSYCGACAKEWFKPQNGSPSAYTIGKKCPTCRQSVRAIKPSTQLASMIDIYLKHNPHQARDKEEIERLAKIYSPGDRITVDGSSADRSNRNSGNLSSRRAGDGWWDGWVDDVEEENDQFYAAISASIRDLIPRATTGLNSPGMLNVHGVNSTIISSGASAASRSEALSRAMSAATALGSSPRVNCDSCNSQNIQASIHYHCSICQSDDYDICHGCFTRGVRCFSTAPVGHELVARRYNTETRAMEKGIFCDQRSCRKNCNDMFWTCSACTTDAGTFKYCPDCVNNAACCSHDLTAFSANPRILVRCGLQPGSRENLNSDIVPPKPVAVKTRCDLCSHPIAPGTTYFHCRDCPEADWDCHPSCLYLHNPQPTDGLVRCMAHHPMQTLVQIQLPNAHNPSHFIRRPLSNA